jgi:hypothetical protein
VVVLPDLAALSPLGAAVLAALATAVVFHARARSRWRVPLRIASGSADPEVRRAAVLLASCNGVSHHLALLLRWTRTETDEAVLSAMARVIHGGLRMRRPGSRTTELLLWAERHVASCSRLAPRPHGEVVHQQPATEAVALIDPLELIEAVSMCTTTALPPSAGVERRWRAAVGAIDALEILETLSRSAANGRGPKTGVAELRPAGAARSWRAGPDEIDALLAADVSGSDQRRASARPARQRSRASG